MAVIINEFEIIGSEPVPPAADQPAAEATTERPAPGLSPMDISDILCYEAERMARVRAH